MATRTLEIDLRQGTGASSEPMYGVVTVQRAKAKRAGGFEILPFVTTLKLINGKATITEAETDGTGPLYDSVYLFRVQNGYCAPRWGFMAALPDGSTPITTGELPMVDPITGEGIYMDAQEWNALYGDLPSRVSALENDYRTTTEPLTNGWSGSVVRFRRSGGVVTCTVRTLTGTSATADAFCAIPLGYQPVDADGSRGLLHTAEATPRIARTHGGQSLNSPQRLANLYGTLSWITLDTIPM